MPATLANTVRSTLEPSDNPYLGGAWRPTFNEWDAAFATGEAEVIGTIPTDIDGVYVRNTENPVHQPLGRYHPFDGDGMLHAIASRTARPAIATASSAPRASRPSRRRAAPVGRSGGASVAVEEAGLGRARGAEGLVLDRRHHPRRAILSTFYQCGEAYRIDPYTLEPMGTDGWCRPRASRPTPRSTRRPASCCSSTIRRPRPTCITAWSGADNQLKHYGRAAARAAPAARHGLHDELVDPQRLPAVLGAGTAPKGFHVARFHADMKSRFGLIPRFGGGRHALVRGRRRPMCCIS